ncbi:MAG: hypothetical protein P1U68_15950 [Verrucomicrobiales bacterium]|nr:hypothetical protein [Verrucomicrobiales bacterium]
MPATVTPLSAPERLNAPEPPRAATPGDSVAIEVDQFLHSLPLFGSGNLILRGGGLSIFHPCRFGRPRQTLDGYLEDLESGLQLRPRSLTAIWLIQPPESPPRFEVKMKDSGVSFAFYPDLKEAGSVAEIERIARRAHQIKRIQSHEPPPTHAVWLDQQLTGKPEAWNNNILLQRTNDSYAASVVLRSNGLIFQCSFAVTLIDVVENVFRLASSGAKTVLHFSPANLVSRIMPKECGGGLHLSTSASGIAGQLPLLQQWIDQSSK